MKHSIVYYPTTIVHYSILGSILRFLRFQIHYCILLYTTRTVVYNSVQQYFQVRYSIKRNPSIVWYDYAIVHYSTLSTCSQNTILLSSILRVYYDLCIVACFTGSVPSTPLQSLDLSIPTPPLDGPVWSIQEHAVGRPGSPACCDPGPGIASKIHPPTVRLPMDAVWAQASSIAAQSAVLPCREPQSAAHSAPAAGKSALPRHPVHTRRRPRPRRKPLVWCFRRCPACF